LIFGSCGDTMPISREEGPLVALGDRKVQTGVEPGMERKLRLAIASVQSLYSHVDFGTSLELTRLESNRDE